VGAAYEDRGRFSVGLDGYVFLAPKNAEETKTVDTAWEASAGETTRQYRRNGSHPQDMDRAFGVSAGAEAGLSGALCLRFGGFSVR